MKKKVEDKKLLIIVLSIILLILIIITILLNIKSPEEKQAETLANLQAEEREQELEELSEETEMQRMKTYLGKFIDAVEQKKWTKVSEILYDEFETNYLNSERAIETYFTEYFPSLIVIDVKNIERVTDNMYVLEVGMSDAINGNKNTKEKNMYFVIRENAYNDFDLSFSVDRAM